MSKNKEELKKPAKLLEDGEQSLIEGESGPEPDNFDQTDFIENSSFSFQEGDIFPNNKDIEDLFLGKKKDGVATGEAGNGNADKIKKTALFPPWLLMIFGGFVLLIFLIIVVVIIAATGQNRTNQTQVDEKTITENQKALNLMEERILAIENLEDTLVLPQTRELIIP